MKKMGLNEIREKFLSFYEEKKHFRRSSFSLIPEKDKSLLIINSGMAPLKPYFSGEEKPPAPRMVTCQKCIRTADIENVGITSRHGTFFEMLGSFSFGDYFKKESIKWGWEFLTDILKIPQENLWVTVYHDDKEAYNIWKDDIGFPKEKIVPLGKDDNFWEIGTGPCGPCSEIYFDRGPEFGCDSPQCKPGCDCDRYVEFWNHVFTQFSRKEDGNYVPLEKPNIDTGMGLERIACIMQDVDSIFDVDTIKAVLQEVCKISRIKYRHGKSKNDVSIRIITDHIRSSTFMIGDKIMPSNEGRGYVLRRLIRRAVRHGKKLGIQGEFLSQLADIVISTSKEAYPELEKQNIYIKKIIENEENRFQLTLNQGLAIIEKEIALMRKSNIKELSGEKAFKLHDTYGFPLEITEEILFESGFAVDRKGFDENMKKQKQAGKEAAANEKVAWEQSKLSHLFQGNTVFTGYEKVHDISKVVAIYKDEEELSRADVGETVNLIVERTPFYPKGGGQEWDTGVVLNDKEGFKGNITAVTKKDNIIIHEVEVKAGSLTNSTEVSLHVNIEDRNNTARNHSCTHLLHTALRNTLGEHVQQAGSGVNKDNLRFDFSHFEALTPEELENIEQEVNKQINLFLPVVCEKMDIENAKKTGATGLFENKYGDKVRIVSMGNFSKELCGGIHVSNTGQIGSFKIVSETGIASGVRRIEALTAEGIFKSLKEEERITNELSQILKTNKENLLHKVDSLDKNNRELKNTIDELKKNSMGNISESLIEKAEEINGMKLVAFITDEGNPNDLKELSDNLRNNRTKLICLLVHKGKDKGTIIFSLSKDLAAENFHAGNLVREIAAAAGGGGGGKPDMAQAGIKDIGKIPQVLDKARELIKKQ